MRSRATRKRLDGGQDLGPGGPSCSETIRGHEAKALWPSQATLGPVAGGPSWSKAMRGHAARVATWIEAVVAPRLWPLKPIETVVDNGCSEPQLL